MIEPHHRVPASLLINREAVGAILSILLEIAIPTSKKQHVSIFVSWLPQYSGGALEKLPA